MHTIKGKNIDGVIIDELSTCTEGENKIDLDAMLDAVRLLDQNKVAESCVLHEVYGGDELIRTMCNLTEKEAAPHHIPSIFGIPFHRMSEELLPEDAIGIIKVGMRLHAIIYRDRVVYLPLA